MKLRFKGGKTSQCLEFDTETKKYIKWRGTGSGLFVLDTSMALRDLEITLIKDGYVEEKNDEKSI